jgi:hypothetical protein
MWNSLDEDSEYFNKDILSHPSYKTLYKKMGNMWNHWYAKWVSERSDLIYEHVIEMLTTENANNGQWWFTAEEMLRVRAIDHII